MNPSLVQVIFGFGSPDASHVRFLLSPGSTTDLLFGSTLVIFGGTENGKKKENFSETSRE